MIELNVSPSSAFVMDPVTGRVKRSKYDFTPEELARKIHKRRMSPNKNVSSTTTGGKSEEN